MSLVTQLGVAEYERLPGKGRIRVLSSSYITLRIAEIELTAGGKVASNLHNGLRSAITALP